MHGPSPAAQPAQTRRDRAESGTDPRNLRFEVRGARLEGRGQHRSPLTSEFEPRTSNLYVFGAPPPPPLLRRRNRRRPFGRLPSGGGWLGGGVGRLGGGGGAPPPDWAGGRAPRRRRRRPRPGRSPCCSVRCCAGRRSRPRVSGRGGLRSGANFRSNSCTFLCMNFRELESCLTRSSSNPQ